MSKNEPVIELENVNVKFGDFQVHRNINFKIYRGQVVTLLGPSGTGKTVILKLIMGLLFPTSGVVRILGNDLSQLKERDLVTLRAQIGMLFQGAALFDSLTVFENVAYSLREKNVRDEVKISQIVKECLSVVGLPDGIEKKSPPALSGGQKKRVGLARALASAPKIVLFDEPTTGLDPTATRVIGDLILKLKRELNITSLVVTHDIDTARRISDRWILINQGQVVADGQIKQIEESNLEVRDFVTGQWSEDGSEDRI